MKDETRHSWRDVRDHIRGQILNSTYRPGDKLPRDQDIAAELDCARTTVHRAMQSLADDGLVERRRKGGTTVSPDPIARTTLDIPITRIEIETRGHAYFHHVIDTSEQTAPPGICARMGLSTTDPVFHVRALHLADGKPYMFEDRWISLDTVPEFQHVDLSQTSANEWLVRNRPYSRCEVQIFADKLCEEEAGLLETGLNAAHLVLERTTWLDETPITHVRSVHAHGYRLYSR